MRLAVNEALIRENVGRVLERIADAASGAGRRAEDVRLLAVTKSVGVDEARFLLELGLSHLGENRLETATEKIGSLGSGISWHMIGSIQRRKSSYVVEMFDYVDSVVRM